MGKLKNVTVAGGKMHLPNLEYGKVSNNPKEYSIPFVNHKLYHMEQLGIIHSTNYTARKEKNYRRLLNEKIELQKKKTYIENRLTEIQNDLNVRREEIRSGRI